MISKLLFRHQNIFQLLLAVAGALAGLFVLLASFEAYLDFKNLLSVKTGLINPQFLIINKKVSLLNTLTFSKNTFTPEEINALKNVNTVERVGEFTSNNFSAQAFVEQNDEKNIPGFYTDLFFESVPDEFIDVKSEKWKWSPGDSAIPVIIPADYLNLYNFGFAPSQNLPQISKKTVEAASFKIKIKGKDTSAVLTASIAGFSDRINSFLVPGSFLRAANEAVGEKKIHGPSRLIVVSNNPASPQLMKYLDEHGYETNSENLKNSKLSLVLRIMMNVMAAIGGMIILLSLLGFVQYSQLLVHRSKYEIRTLVQLGYYHVTLFKKYFILYLLLFLGILAITCWIISGIKKVFVTTMQANGFEILPGISTEVIITGIALTILFIVITGVSLYRNMAGIARPS